MSDENFGKAAFSKEEIDKEIAEEAQRQKEYEEKLANGFFSDGKVLNVVLTDVTKEEKTSKAGKNYTLHTYVLTDVDTRAIETVKDFNFAISTALRPIKKELGTSLRLGVTVLTFTCTKTGENQFNGINYPIWSFDIVVKSNPDAPVAATPAEGQPFE